MISCPRCRSVFTVLRNNSVFVETPCLTALGNDELVVIQGSYLYPDIVEGLEAKRFFNKCGVCLFSVDRVTLDKQAIARVLENSINTAHIEIPKPNDGTGETNVFGITIIHTPLSPKIASFTSLLAGSQKK